MAQKESEVSNPYIEELKKFIGSDVDVIDFDNNCVTGRCVGICFNHLNVIIRTKEEKIIVRNVKRISRLRSNPEV